MEEKEDIHKVMLLLPKNLYYMIINFLKYIIPEIKDFLFNLIQYFFLEEMYLIFKKIKFLKIYDVL